MNSLKKCDMWKIQSAIANNFISSTDNDEQCLMPLVTYKLLLMMKEMKLQKNFLNRSKEDIKIIWNLWKVVFVFDYVHLLYCKCYEINVSCGGSYIGSLIGWKIKKAPLNYINKKENKCFQYAITVALNYEEIGKHLKRVTKVRKMISEKE